MKTTGTFLMMAGTAAVLFFSGLFSCSDEPIEPVMTLYDKPLSTIKKVIEGKWKIYRTVVNGFIYDVRYPENSFIEFKKNHYIRYNEDRRDTVYFTWKKLPIANWRDPLEGYETYIMWNEERNDGDYYIHSISNDTLEVEGYIVPDGMSVVRIK